MPPAKQLLFCQCTGSSQQNYFQPVTKRRCGEWGYLFLKWNYHSGPERIVSGDSIRKPDNSHTNTTPSPKPTKKPVPTPNPDKESPYKDGTYTGTAQGYSGTVTLTAKIKKGIIKSLDVKHTDTPQFFQKAWEVLENSIIQNQSADGIDTVSGATYSSKGILNAMKRYPETAAKNERKK